MKRGYTVGYWEKWKTFSWETHIHDSKEEAKKRRLSLQDMGFKRVQIKLIKDVL